MRNCIVFIVVLLILLGISSCNKYTYKFSSTSSGTFPEGFSSEYIIVSEGDGMVTIPFYLHHKTIEDLDITLVSGGPTIGATEGVDFEMNNIIVSEVRPSLIKYDIQLIIKDNFQAQSDRFFQLKVNGKFSKENFKKSIIVFIKDNDHNFIKKGIVGLEYLSSYKMEEPGQTEFLTYSPETNHLFVIGEDKVLSKISIRKNNSLQNQLIASIDLNSEGIPSSVEFIDGFLLVTIDKNFQKRGEVLLIDEKLNILDRKEVGHSPVNIAYSKGSNIIAIPCKGYPAPDYSIDPAGAIAIVKINKEQMFFEQIDLITFERSNLSRNKLSRNGVRIKGPFASIAQDLEPQSATFFDENKLIVNFQENNAYGIIDLSGKTLDTLISYKWVNHAESGFGFDAQVNITQPLIINWPVQSLLQPSDICQYSINGQQYLITANSGKPRQYELYNETTIFSDLNPRASEENLTKLMEFNTELMLGNLIISNADGDIDRDGYIDRVVKFGSRSISIFNLSSNERIWDSGEQIERRISSDPNWRAIFNADYSSNTSKTTSAFKGVKPTKIICKEIKGRQIVFALLENFGGVAVFDVTNPENSHIIDFQNSRYHLDLGGDLKPTDLLFIDSINSGLDYDLLVIANSESGSLSFYKIL